MNCWELPVENESKYGHSRTILSILLNNNVFYIDRVFRYICKFYKNWKDGFLLETISAITFTRGRFSSETRDVIIWLVFVGLLA